MATDGPQPCTATTKTGEPCKASPLKETNRCLAHSDQETRDSTGFGGSQPGAGRPPVPRTTEVQRQLVQENAIAVLRPYWLTLGYDVELTAEGPVLKELPDGGAKLFGESKEGEIRVSGHADLAAMIAAAERLQDRVFGRPKQSTEISAELTLDDKRLQVEIDKELALLMEARDRNLLTVGSGDGGA